MFRIFDDMNKPNRIPPNNSRMTKEQVLAHILNGGLARLTTLQTQRRGRTVYLPELQFSIEPVVDRITDNTAGIFFRMYSALWKTDLIEFSSGVGPDAQTALGLSLGTFAFSFLQGLKNIADHRSKETVTSGFAGNPHKWEVYAGNLTGTGQKTAPAVSEYWELIRDDVIKRLGNQNAVYVKIFLGKIGDHISGECRINDIPVPEISKKIAAVAEQWSAAGYVSEKQFFFLVQEPETKTAYPYEGTEGDAKIQKAVDTYLQLFSLVDSQEMYDRIIADTDSVIHDFTLATECRRFIADIIAEHFFQDKLQVDDALTIRYPDGKAVTAYRTQLSDYPAIRKAVFHALDTKLLGDRTKAVFSHLITMSGVGKAAEIYDAQGKTGISTVSGFELNVGADFTVR